VQPVKQNTINVGLSALHFGKANTEVIMMKNYANGSQMPMGLGMALAKNLDAMNYFATLSPDQQQQVINHTHVIQSKEQMQQYVQRLAENKLDLF